MLVRISKATQNQIPMHRDKFTEKLVRIIATLESKVLPFKVRELYVFGSYSRGAIEPGDLDLIVVHDPPPRKYNLRLLDELKKHGVPSWDVARVHRRFEAERLRPLRRPGERIQIIFVGDVSEATGEGSRINPEDPILIWRSKDWTSKWKKRLAAIVVDEAAGRAHRNHLVSLSRLNCTVGEMEATVRMIDKGRLTFARLVKDTISPELDAEHARKLSRCEEFGRLGKKTLEAMPYAALCGSNSTESAAKTLARK